MKIIERIEVDAVTDIVCDICLCSTRVDGGGLQFAIVQAHWGYGAKHDGERYELHLCETCFFQTRGYLKRERRTQNLFNDEEGAFAGDDFGMIAKDDFFGDSK
ncbi:hypothetical protein B0D71_18105 [Pseudomonas laurylsulfativorans]|uniref:Uncharacterized protein n=2 Tax=Pseudomonas TaxID=286 RepID=A0A2S3VNC6_9PSED|nr:MULTISPECIES: hypothetical protein [Pseudomonas]POF41149.1 hypothetical protein B0D71_18105 [Pseudomonas laurylsulfativorans]PPK37301.1 hypothetical protein CD175_20935 [Pseudomonas laurylsulfatiphila]